MQKPRHGRVLDSVTSRLAEVARSGSPRRTFSIMRIRIGSSIQPSTTVRPFLRFPSLLGPALPNTRDVSYSQFALMVAEVTRSYGSLMVSGGKYYRKEEVERQRLRTLPHRRLRGRFPPFRGLVSHLRYINVVKFEGKLGAGIGSRENPRASRVSSLTGIEADFHPSTGKRFSLELSLRPIHLHRPARVNKRMFEHLEIDGVSFIFVDIFGVLQAGLPAPCSHHGIS